MFDNLKNKNKARLAIYLLENKNFDINFNIKDKNIIILLKEVLNKLDPNYSKTIVNFTKYKNLLFILAKYLELSEKEKKNFSIISLKLILRITLSIKSLINIYVYMIIVMPF